MDNKKRTKKVCYELSLECLEKIEKLKRDNNQIPKNHIIEILVQKQKNKYLF